MSPRKTILRELRAHSTSDDDRFVRPSRLEGYAERSDDYHKAVNELLQERLIEGRKDDGGQLAIAINEHRSADVQRELRGWYAKPAAWLAFVLATGLAVVFVV